jgi:outer membrane protein TolC
LARRARAVGGGGAALLAAVFVVGPLACTPAEYARRADVDAGKMIREGQLRALGAEHAFDVEYDPLLSSGPTGRQVIEVGETVIPLGRGGEPVLLTLDECLRIAFRSSRSFQDRKESLFREALAVANARREWGWGLLGGEVDGELESVRDEAGDHTFEDSAAVGVGPTWTRRFLHGGALVLGATVDLATDFVGGTDTTIGSLLSAEFSQPLLQGAWRGLAYEEQYRRERDFLFAVFEYERFTQEFATRIVADYYRVIRLRDQLENERQNIERLRQTLKLTSVLVANGEATVVEQDQAVRQVLQAEVRFQGSQQDYEDAVDRFKLTLGLPIAANLELNYEEAIGELLESRPEFLEIGEGRAVEIALRARPDVLSERAKLRDAERDVQIAADKFLPQLDLSLSVAAAGTEDRQFWRTQFDEHRRVARLTLDYDLDQTDNRDNYRVALLALSKARRDLDGFLDEVRLAVREEYRTLRRSHRNYQIELERVRVARRGRKLALLQQKEGLADTRDVLEAEEALRQAQNGLTAELVRYTSTRLRFLATLGLIQVDQQGAITVLADPEDFARLAGAYPYVAPDGAYPEGE